MVYQRLCICCEPAHSAAYVLVYLCNLLNATGLLQGQTSKIGLQEHAYATTMPQKGNSGDA
jgi:hypothetical protein